MVIPATLLVASLFGSLSVAVVDGSGAILPGTTVELVQRSETVTRAMADKNGHAMFFPLEPGTYLVRARLDGFFPQETEIRVSRGKMKYVEIPLFVAPAVRDGLSVISCPEPKNFSSEVRQ